MIEINGVQKSFGDLKVLEDINLKIQERRYLRFGRSKAAPVKAPCCAASTGWTTYDSGSIKVNGIEVKELDKKGLRLFPQGYCAMIFQHFPLMSRKTVFMIILPFPCAIGSMIKRRLIKKLPSRAGRDCLALRTSWEMKLQCAFRRPKAARSDRQGADCLEPKTLLSDESTSSA